MRSCSSAAAAAAGKSFTASAPAGRGKRVSFIHGVGFFSPPPEIQIGVLRFQALARGCGDSNLPNLVRNPPLLPVASESDQLELETANEDETPKQKLPDQDDSPTVHIRLQLRRKCRFGEQFFIAGDHPALGLWKPLDAAPMVWSEGHVWTTELDLPAGNLIQFKFILRDISGKILWQPGPNRVLQTWETSNIIVVFGDWEKLAVQQVIQECNRDNLYEVSDELMIHEKKQLTNDAAGSNNEKEKPRLESCNGGIASLNGEAIATVAENIAHHTLQDNGGYERKELLVERQVKISSSINLVLAQRVNSHDDLKEEFAISNKALKRSKDILEMKQEVTVLVPGLTPCSITPAEDATSMEEDDEFALKRSKDILEVKQEVSVLVPGLTPCLITPAEDATSLQEEDEFEAVHNARNAIAENREPECLHCVGKNQIQLELEQEEIEGYRQNEEEEEEEKEVIAELMFDKEHAQKEYPNKPGFVNGIESDQGLQLILYEGLGYRNNGILKWGQETLRRFLNKLGFQ